MAQPDSSSITLYTDATPNGIKISVALEFLGLVSRDMSNAHQTIIVQI